MEMLRNIQERQKKRSERLNIQPWQEAFCARMVPWFENAKMVYEERERLTAMAQMNKLAPLEALKRTNNRSHEGSLQMAGLLTGQEAERYEKAVEAINALPEKFIRFALDVGMAVEMRVYDIYTTNFGNIVFAAQQLIQN